jgi:superfamily I DNA and/or RNA helicase
MYLREHRRCVPEIIAYCNDLAYQGRLKPLRENDVTDLWLPHMGYLLVQGEEKTRYGSRGNEVEAKAVAEWMVHERERLEAYYKKPIDQVAGVVTPFRWQMHLIKQNLKNAGISQVTVGTVHALQGAERNVIVFSPVYTSNKKGFFFDQNKNMLNVAVSRAKDSFLVIGSVDQWNPKDKSKPSGLLAHYLFEREYNRISSIVL